jgi:hypothetical protein
MDQKPSGFQRGAEAVISQISYQRLLVGFANLVPIYFLPLIKSLYKYFLYNFQPLADFLGCGRRILKIIAKINFPGLVSPSNIHFPPCHRFSVTHVRDHSLGVEFINGCVLHGFKLVSTCFLVSLIRKTYMAFWT